MGRSRIAPLVSLSLVVLAAAAACSASEDNPAIPRDGTRSAGTEGGPCRATGTGCVEGLLCVAEICVRPDSGGRDAAVNDASSEAASCPSSAPLSGTSCSGETCYCNETASCFAAAIADSCCPGPVVCGTGDGGNPEGGQCSGTHPLVDGGARFCTAGHCYCDTPDSCFAFAIATACCAGPSVVCY